MTMEEENSMSNIIKSTGVATGAVAVPNFHADLGEEPRRIKIAVKNCKTKDGKKTFKSVKGYMRIAVYDKDENFIGNHVRKIDIHFTKDAFKGCTLLTAIDDLKSGYLYVKAKGLQLPPIYKIEKDEKGNDVYPAIWIKSDIIGLQPFVASQASLDVDDNDDAVDAEYDEETGEAEFDTVQEDYEQYEAEEVKEG